MIICYTLSVGCEKDFLHATINSNFVLIFGNNLNIQKCPKLFPTFGLVSMDLDLQYWACPMGLRWTILASSEGSREQHCINRLQRFLDCKNQKIVHIAILNQTVTWITTDLVSHKMHA